MKAGNLFAGGAGEREQVFPLVENAAVRIERIVSNSEASPAEFWYDQEDDEWVALLCGSATLEFATGEMRVMKAGDWVLIERQVRHRVAAVSRDAVWLAVHHGW